MASGSGFGFGFGFGFGLPISCTVAQECGDDEWAWEEATGDVCMECAEDDEDDKDEGGEKNWQKVVRRANSQWCGGFSTGSVGCREPTCIGCQLALSVLSSGPCAFPGCQHQCTAKDNAQYGGVCFRHRGGPCSSPECQHQCTAKDMRDDGGVCVRCRKGEVAEFRIGNTNSSKPNWTPEEKARLCELAVQNTVGGKVQWAAFKHQLPGGRNVASAKLAFVRVRAAQEAAATPAPPSSKRPKTGGKGKQGS